MKAASLASILLHDLDDADLLKWRRALPEALKSTTKQRLINDLKAALNAFYDAHRKQLPSTFPGAVKRGLRAEAMEEAEPVARENQILSDAQVGQLIPVLRAKSTQNRAGTATFSDWCWCWLQRARRFRRSYG